MKLLTHHRHWVCLKTADHHRTLLKPRRNVQLPTVVCC